MLPHRFGQSNTAGWSEALNAGSDIDPISENIAIFNDNIPDVDANTELDADYFGYSLLNSHGTADRVHHACELRKQSIASCLEYTSGMLSDFGLDKFSSNYLRAANVPASSSPMSLL
jgi:hypothetical protein